MTDDEPLQAPVGRGATRGERWVCAALGVLLLGGGAAAVFVTDNELGSLGLLVLGALFAALAVFGLVPSRVSYGGGSVDLARLRAVVDRVAAEPDPAARRALAGVLARTLAEPDGRPRP